MTLPPGSRETVNQPKRNRITQVHHNNGNRRGSVFGRLAQHWRPGATKTINLETNEFGGKCRESIDAYPRRIDPR